MASSVCAKCCSAGEPLNPEVIEHVERAWGLTIRDGYGQTETTLQVGNTPGQPVKPGSMGRPAPGYAIRLLDIDGATRAKARFASTSSRARRPDARLLRRARVVPMREGVYRTGDVGARDADGYLTYVGRADDVFKASDYRISPFELESVLIEHAAVAEAAVVPAPDALRLAVPKAFIALAAAWSRSRDGADDFRAYPRRGWRRTSGSVASSFSNCRRRSPAKSAA